MALKFADCVKETTTTTGTGTINLAGVAGSGYITFVAGVGNGAVVAYRIKHQSADEWEVGVGTVTDASPDTLSRTSILSSTNAGAAVNFSAGTKDVFLVNPADLISERPEVCCGRLTLETGVPISITDQTAKGTLYWTPYLGNKVSLWNGARWKTYTFSELSIAVPSEVFRIYDVFVYDNAGTLTLELTAWDSGGQTTGTITGATNATPVVITSASHGRSVGDLVGINGIVGNTAPNGKIWYLSNTTTTFTLEGSVGNGAYSSGGTWYLIPTARTTAITLQDGIYVKSGATTRRYLGTFMTTNTSAQTEDSTKRRFVWNYYNRVHRTILGMDGTDSWTYNGALRAANANTNVGEGQILCVIGVREDATHLSGCRMVVGSSASTLAYMGIGVNRTAVNSAQAAMGITPQATGGTTVPFEWDGTPNLGFNFFQTLEAANAATTTWYGDNGSTIGGGLVSAMVGNLRC